MSRFERDFGSDARLATPIQSDENGWLYYLSRSEARELLTARKIGLRAGLAGVASAGAVMLTATVAAPFAFVAATAITAAAGAIGLHQTIKAKRLERHARRRKADAEVSARHAKTPQGPRV